MPAGGRDLALEPVCVAVGAAMGAIGRLASLPRLAALVLMALDDVLTRLVVIYLRGRRPADPAASAAAVPAGARA